MEKYGTTAKLDVLVDSENWEDRRDVTQYDYGLDKLINDKDHRVRAAVAKQGYGLNILVKDEYYNIWVAVQEYLKEHNYVSIEDWASKNPDKVCD